MTGFKETQIIQCPTRKSFDAHFKAWDKIEEIGRSHDCDFHWSVLNEKEKTFILKLCGCSKQHQQNALIDVMKFLCKEGIDPAIIISTKTEKSEEEKQLLRVQRILKSA